MPGLERNQLRRQMLARRDQLPEEERQRKSEQIANHLFQLSRFAEAEHLFIYVAFRSEVETLPLIRRCLDLGKTVSVPLTLVSTAALRAVRLTDPDRQLQAGYCGIPEPVPEWAAQAEIEPERIDIALVPGSAFDRRGGRMGYGGGYYDRFLANQAPGALRIGLAYEMQVMDRIAMQPHDQFMHLLVTEQTVYECGGGIEHAQNSNLPE